MFAYGGFDKIGEHLGVVDHVHFVVAGDDHGDFREDVHVLLSALASEDERVLRLAIMNGLDGVSLAKALNITPGAARVRLHRALGRLRVVYNRQQENDHA